MVGLRRSDGKNEDEEESYEQFRKRTFDQSSSSSDYQSKRSLNQ